MGSLQNFINQNKNKSSQLRENTQQSQTSQNTSYSVADDVLGSSGIRNREISKTRLAEREPLPRYVYLLFIDDKRLDVDSLECDVFVYSKQETALRELYRISQDYINYYNNLPEKYRNEMEIVFEQNKKCVIMEGDFLIASVNIEKKVLL